MISVVDNALPENYLNQLSNHIDNNLVWCWQEYTTIEYSSIQNTPESFWDKQMTALILHDGKRVSNFYDFFYPVLYVLEQKFDLNMKYVQRMKINKTFTCPDNIYMEAWHQDAYNNEGRSIVLYLDDSDGDTIISNVIAEDHIKSEDIDTIITKDTPRERIQYKKNRAVLFPSNLYHYGEMPKKHKCRTVLNIVFAL